MRSEEDGSMLHFKLSRPDGGTGRRAGLKNQFRQLNVGSIPTPGTLGLKKQSAQVDVGSIPTPGADSGILSHLFHIIFSKRYGG